MFTLTDAVQHLEAAAKVEAEAKHALERAEDAMVARRITRADFADCYEAWLSAKCAVLRAERNLAVVHGRR
jgi:hypothetical protein